MRVLFVEDDRYFASLYANALKARGCNVFYAEDPRDALSLADTERPVDVVVLDIMMPHEVRSPDDDDCENRFQFDIDETLMGRRTGVALLRELRQSLPDTKFIALTNSHDPEVQEWFDIGTGYAYCYKGDYSPSEFANFVIQFTNEASLPMRAFIVHGHDQVACLQLKNYLQNSIGLPEPTILAEKPSRGMTLIEKFEHYAEDADLVFALFTPDDLTGDSGGGRARQNVVFEYGYFMGSLGRRSGRVFLLHKGSTEIPSDIRGVIYIDISSGIEAAGEQIRRELRGILHPNRSE